MEKEARRKASLGMYQDSCSGTSLNPNQERQLILAEMLQVHSHAQFQQASQYFSISTQSLPAQE